MELFTLEVPMSDEILDLLSEVHALQRKYGRAIEPPASTEQIAVLRDTVRAELGVDLPDGYAKFLAVSNGLDWNGTLFYATERRAKAPGHPFLDGVVPANLDVRDNGPSLRLLVLGESGMEIYVHDLVSSAFRIVDRVSLDTYESYESFDELFAAAIKKRL
jgi:hypothetical protein